MRRFIYSLVMFLVANAAYAANGSEFIHSLPAKVNALGQESLPSESRIDRTSPIIFARSELTILISNKVEVKDEEVEAKKEDLPWMKPEEPKEKKFKTEKSELHLMVEVKESESFIHDEEAYIDMRGYAAKGGVLVVYPKFGKHSLSLANLSSGADFVFMDTHGRITEVYPNLVPGAAEVIQNSKPSYAVLIMQPGIADEAKIKAGDYVQHKALDMPQEMIEMTGKPAAKQGVGNSSSPIIFDSKGK